MISLKENKMYENIQHNRPIPVIFQHVVECKTKRRSLVVIK